MSLWGKTDTLASAPKWRTKAITVVGTVSTVNTTSESITSPEHGFDVAEAVMYTTDGTGLVIAGLANNTIYYTIRTNANDFKLATTAPNAIAGTAIDLTTTGGAAVVHTFKRVPLDLFLVDLTEAAVAANRAKGLQVPGWNKFVTYTDCNGATRRRVEVMVPFKQTQGAAGDAGVTGVTATEDTTVADT